MSYFVNKLRCGARLTDSDEHTLLSLLRQTRRVDARADIVVEGLHLKSLIVIVDGWACRYQQLENGKKQIVTILLPGDLSEPFGCLPQFMDSSIGALSPVVFANVSPDALKLAVQSSPRIEEALWWDLLLSSAAEREHIVSLGRRTAVERLGHLFCELHARLALVGLTNDCSFEMPMTQSDLADLLGLSAVHVNRSLQDLRAAGLVSLRGRHLTIPNLKELREASLFDPSYLNGPG